MLVIKIGGILYNFPTSHGELTLRQFFRIRKEDPDMFDLLEILSGRPRQDWEQETNLDQIERLRPLIAYIEDAYPEFDKFMVPDYLIVGDKKYNLPEALGYKTLAQRYAFEDAIRANTDDVELMPHALAIYFQPDIDGTPFDVGRIPAIIEIIMDCKVNECFPISGFFFERYKQYCKGKTQSLQVSRQQMMKSGLEVISLPKYQDTRRFGVLRGFLVRLLRKCFSGSTKLVSRNFNTRKGKQTINLN